MIGVPDPTHEETPCATVVLDEGASLTAEELVAHCRERIACDERPRHEVFVDAVPRNVGGEVLERRPREEYAHLGHPAGAP